MRFILVSAVLLAQAFTTLAQHPAQVPYDAQGGSSCEELAKARGVPVETVCRLGSLPYGFPDNHNPCESHPVCGSGKYLGIKYGHCYILSFSNGQQLGTVRENTLYSKGGFFQDIPFKVCKKTDDCARGNVVQMGESFYLEDQQGRYNDPKGTKGWIDNSAGGAHIGFTLDATKAGAFEGIPTCGGGECAIKLLGGPTKSPNSPTCPAVLPGISFYGNPKMHDPIRFSEVTCDDYEVPPTSGISPNFREDVPVY